MGNNKIEKAISSLRKQTKETIISKLHVLFNNLHQICKIHMYEGVDSQKSGNKCQEIFIFWDICTSDKKKKLEWK